MPTVLDTSSLVLNQHWTPVHVTSVRHALVLAFSQRAQIICPVTFAPHEFPAWLQRGVRAGRQSIHTVTVEIEAPEIVVLCGFAKLPPSGVVFNRRNLYRRDESRCQYCTAKLTPRELTIDHVTPISRGGLTSWENCVLACRRCNGRKGNQTLKAAKMSLPKRPTQPHWSPIYAIGHRKHRPASWDNFLPRTR